MISLIYIVIYDLLLIYEEKKQKKQKQNKAKQNKKQKTKEKQAKKNH